jgi:hypothetical protein
MAIGLTLAVLVAVKVWARVGPGGSRWWPVRSLRAGYS